MTGRFAVKRLVAVEIQPDRSHQHEFHGGKLRTGLGLGDKTTRGLLRLLIFTDDAGEPVLDEGEYTLYDARSRHPKRSEWHLYYRTRELPRLAKPHDLLVLYRAESNSALHGVVLPAGSGREKRLLDALRLRDEDVLREFRLVDAPHSSDRVAHGVGAALTLGLERTSASAIEYPTAEHALVARAVSEHALPLTRELADAAADVVGAQLARQDPDQYLYEALEAETDLFFRIEDALGRSRLDELVAANAPLGAVLDWAMSTHQARRARRGLSLQLHFQKILERWGLRFSAQCRTEAGETPDFVVPGCAAYHDPTYPADRLRMVACKSTSKERWRQVLNEADRIQEKYLLTLDAQLTGPVIIQMTAARLRPFLPAPVIRSSYGAIPERRYLGTVTSLLEELEAAIA